MSETTEIWDEPEWFSRLWAMFLLLLIAVTFPLWFAAPDLPGMPAVSLGLHVVAGLPAALPRYLYLIPSTGLVIGLLLIVVAPRRFRSLWWLVAMCLLISFVLDQHRLQPWAYQSAIYALVFAAIDPPRTRRYLIPLAASVYLYSAAGKLDFQFSHTVGQQFLEAITQPIGGLRDRLDEAARVKLALIFPVMELLCGVGLLIPTARIIAAAAVMIMHVALMIMLGPWALDHSDGVLVWNLLLIVQAYLLIIKPAWSDSVADQRIVNEAAPQQGVRVWVVRVVVLGALFAPLLERWGYWDHWTSWSLYSPHTSRVDVEIHRSAVDVLPTALRTFLASDENGDGWRTFAMDQWSLSQRRVPIYPQARYQLALAERVAGQLRLTDDIRARRRGVADRWTGQREEQLLMGRGEIQAAMNSYWLNKSTSP